jgi:AhpC/TSA family
MYVDRLTSSVQKRHVRADLMVQALQFSLLVSSLVLSLTSTASGQQTFSGRIDPDLSTADSGGTPIRCTRVTQAEQAMPPIQGKVFGCVASWYLEQGQRLQMPLRLIEPERGKYPVLWVDANQNGVFSDDERFLFVRRRHRYARAEVRFTLPAPPGSAFARFPVVVLAPKAGVESPFGAQAADERFLFQSMFLYATAKVRLDGKTFYFRYSVTPDATFVRLNGTVQAVDRGQLQEDALSPLRLAARGDVPVFRLGNRYVSTESVDLQQRSALIRSRTFRDYRRLELRRGGTIPDFAFLNADGTTRHLTEFRRRYVLLYFGSRGCTPCDSELENIRSARARFGSDRLAILGFMDDNTPAEALRPLLAPAGPFDAHAIPATSWQLIREWFGINAVPTTILLDPEGRIVSRNQQDDGHYGLRGPALLKTLASVLPR